ncbi:hypothetical protein SAMN05660690_4325 [Geodermatophilus telluris]|uniref:SchA/CurD like domain-containing protein n=1 Tax=Geodermatophilus telluris TaxID=1190417 RepID=A0A1G6V5G5_9ACTN|nr:hypothetical protein [Geodermatophilus telluris]SDD48267.1 hypothetical protein SAMN05660690_4325 [Geodermatophilus telluris]
MTATSTTTSTSTTDQPVQHPLTLVLTARSADDRRALQVKIEALQALPREHNPVVRALDAIGTVHFARFVLLDEQRLAVITTYDGDFEAYLHDFVDHVGDVFTDLLQHVAGGPPLPVAEHRQEFLDFVRRHDLACVPPFYSAYPERTVLDIVQAGG